jgi:hypothetical protein
MTSSGNQICITSNIDVSVATFRKSSWSAYNGNCVEFAELGSRLLAVRDSKQQGNGPVLIFTGAEWSVFTARVKSGEFDFR